MKRKNTIKAILDALASERRRGETSLIVRIEPNLFPDAMKALAGYRKLFAPLVPGLPDPLPIYEAYEQMKQTEGASQSVLVFVKCHTTQEFCEALDRYRAVYQGDRISWNTRAGRGSASPKVADS